MELGLLRDLFLQFSTRRERYYFCIEGSTRGGCKVGMLT